MKAVLSACVFAAVAMLAAAAPAPTPDGQTLEPEQQKPETLRPKRSSYGSPYISPCAAASVPIPAIAPSPYHLNLSPVHHGGYAPHNYGYLPQYRADIGEEQEMLNFSDMEPFMSEHMPMARYAYPAPSPHYPGAGYGQLVAPASSGTAFGVFPNANTGGCSVPLLLSCSPSIVPGRIVKTHPQSFGSAVVAGSQDAYRVVDDQGHHHEGHEQAEEHQVHEQLQAAHEASQVAHQ